MDESRMNEWDKRARKRERERDKERENKDGDTMDERREIHKHDNT